MIDLRRGLDSWPYLAVVVGCIASWIIVTKADLPGLSPLDEKSLGLTMLFAVYPTVLFITGTILGFRRGYDWLTLLICGVVWLVFLGVDYTRQQLALSFFDIVTFSTYFLFWAHLGIGAGMLIRRALGPSHENRTKEHSHG